MGAGIAIAGSLLLSTGGTLRLAPGDSWEMAGAVMWAVDVITGEPGGEAHGRADIFRRALFCGSRFESPGQPVFTSIFGRIGGGWWTIIYIGLFSTAIGYTLQALGQKYAPPTDASILLSMEAVFAALAGFIFLGETMLPVQLRWVWDDPGCSDHHPIERSQIEDACSASGWMKKMEFSR